MGGVSALLKDIALSSRHVQGMTCMSLEDSFVNHLSVKLISSIKIIIIMT